MPAGGRDALLLATLAEPLEPDRVPFYVSNSATGHPDGWYWIPATARNGAPQYLGRSVVWAERRLLELIQGRRHA